jgi:O-antigen ligase
MRADANTAVFGLTLGSAAAGLFSIAASQILLSASYLLFLILLLRGSLRLRWPRYFLPLAAFMIATLVSLALSPDPGAGRHAVQKFVLFPIGLLTANLVATERRALIVVRVLLVAGGAAALAGIVEFGFRYATFLQTGLQSDDPTLVNRITGPLSHWMTYSGVLLLVWCAAVPALMVHSRRWLAPLLLIAAALLLGHTRGVWIGAFAALAAIVPALPRRLLLVLLLPLAGIGLAASPLVYRRVATSFDPGLATNYSRAVYADVGARMVLDHPGFGVGPERVDDEFLNYYTGEARDFYFGHLHNNVLQIAAERGLICLGTFLWFVVELLRSFINLYRTPETVPRWVTLGALSALIGFFVAGMTEYNFGDSEVLLLLLFLVSIPFGLALHVQEDPDRQQG